MNGTKMKILDGVQETIKAEKKNLLIVCILCS